MRLEVDAAGQEGETEEGACLAGRCGQRSTLASGALPGSRLPHSELSFFCERDSAAPGPKPRSHETAGTTILADTTDGGRV